MWKVALRIGRWRDEPERNTVPARINLPRPSSGGRVRSRLKTRDPWVFGRRPAEQVSRFVPFHGEARREGRFHRVVLNRGGVFHLR